MNIRRINHEQKAFSLGNTTLRVNIYNGMASFYYPLVSNGSGNYKVDVSLIYNTHYNEFNVLNRLIGFGNGWKMSFQSYLFKYESSYNIPSFTQDDYLFIDEEYCIHRFLKYKTLIESNSSLDVYYDTSGTGLKLYVKENTDPYIVDEYGNTHTFDNITGALISITSSINSNIKKIVTYDEEGKVISISDLRKPNKKIIFSYNENNLLSKVESTSSSIYYTFSYDNTKLLQVTKHNDIEEQLIYEFNYENNRLSRIINMETLQAIALEYDDETRVRKVKEGAVKKEYEKEVLPALVYLNDGSYVSDLNYVGGSTKVIKGFHYVMKEEYNKEVTTFCYYTNYTDITSKKNITSRYYFDIDGTCINIMEKGLDDKLYTINRINGWEVEFSDNSTSYTSTNTYINNKRAVKVQKNDNKYTINFDHLELSDFFQIFTEEIDDEHNYPNPDIIRTIHFSLTFLLSFNNTSTACKKVSFSYKNTDNNEVVVMSQIVSPTLSNVWQEVTIPFILPNNQLKVCDLCLEIEMENTDTLNDDFIMISEMKVIKGYSGFNQVKSNIDNTTLNISIGSTLYYEENNVEHVVTLDHFFYLTSSDLIATYKSMFEQTIIKNKNTFDLYYCNKTKVKEVSYVGMSSKSELGTNQSPYEFRINQESLKYYPNFKQEVLNLLAKYRSDEHLLTSTTNFWYTLNNDNTYTTEIKNEIKTYIPTLNNLEYKNVADVDAYIIKSYENHGLINYEKYHENMYNEFGTSFISTSYVTTYNYDDYGNLISEITESDEDSTLESSSVYYTYDSISPSLREKVIKIQDQANIKEITYNQNDTINKIVYKYNKKYEDGDILSIDEEVSNIIEYEYNDFNNLTKLKFYDKDYNLLHENMISYNKTGNISVLKDNTNTYGFLYNAKDELAEVYKNKILQEKYVSYTSSNLDTNVYQLYNGVIRYITREEFDKYGHIISSTNKESNSDTEAQVLFEYESNNNYASNLSRVTKIIDPYLNGNHTYYYNDDPLDQYVVYDLNNQFSITSFQNEKRINFDYYDKIIHYNFIDNPVSNNPKRTVYSYTDYNNNKIDEDIKLFSYYFEYDKMGRLKRKLEVNETLQNNQELTYYSGTNLIKQLSNQTYIKTPPSEYDIDVSINYENSYLNGNITKIKESGSRIKSASNLEEVLIPTSIVQYEYDNYNQIKKEIRPNGDILEYIYDENIKMLKQVRNNNNIIKEYEYTSNKLTKLINNGNILNIEYDSIGNITKLGQVNLTYNSRNLLKEYYKDNTHNYTFEYDYRGRRIKKIKNNSYVTKYYYDEETLVGEVTIDTNTNSIIRAYIYYYDALGICGIKSITKDENNDITEKNYHLIKNSLGDITKLMCNGVVVGSYSYDAWGNVEIIEESNSDSIDIDTLYNNPFRYRGYYYDVETGLFWLSSRYYSPELCRFISLDDIEYLDPSSVNGLYLYCYCLNNPINYCDPSGHLPEWAAWLISGAAIVGGIVLCATGVGGILGGVLIGAGAGSLINGYVTEANGGDFTAGYIGGAISGALCGVGAGLGGMAFAAAFEATNLACIGYLALGAATSFAGGFAGNLAGTVYTSWHNSGFKNVGINWEETLTTSAIMGALNIFAGMGSAMSSIAGSMGRAVTDASSQFALRFLAGFIAGGTEAAYDITSYILGKLMSSF